jgi:hypothetical protein
VEVAFTNLHGEILVVDNLVDLVEVDLELLTIIKAGKVAQLILVAVEELQVILVIKILEEQALQEL